jgi:hypothetical protein
MRAGEHRPDRAHIKQIEDRSVRCGHENPSGGCPPYIGIIRLRVELLVKGMEEEFKKN